MRGFPPNVVGVLLWKYCDVDCGAAFATGAEIRERKLNEDGKLICVLAIVAESPDTRLRKSGWLANSFQRVVVLLLRINRLFQIQDESGFVNAFGVFFAEFGNWNRSLNYLK